MAPELFNPLPVVSDELPSLVRPMERAAFCASITAIHTVFVSKECRLLIDRSCASEPLALPSGIPPLLIYVRDSGICNRENWPRDQLRSEGEQGFTVNLGHSLSTSSWVGSTAAANKSEIDREPLREDSQPMGPSSALRLRIMGTCARSPSQVRTLLVHNVGIQEDSTHRHHQQQQRFLDREVGPCL